MNVTKTNWLTWFFSNVVFHSWGVNLHVFFLPSSFPFNRILLVVWYLWFLWRKCLNSLYTSFPKLLEHLDIVLGPHIGHAYLTFVWIPPRHIIILIEWKNIQTKISISTKWYIGLHCKYTWQYKMCKPQCIMNCPCKYSMLTYCIDMSYIFMPSHNFNLLLTWLLENRNN